MWKLIFWSIVIWLAIQFIRRGLNSKSMQSQTRSKPEQPNIENMVQCEQCHVHLPRSDAFLVEGKFYCSQAHITSAASQDK